MKKTILVRIPIEVDDRIKMQFPDTKKKIDRYSKLTSLLDSLIWGKQ